MTGTVFPLKTSVRGDVVIHAVFDNVIDTGHQSTHRPAHTMSSHVVVGEDGIVLVRGAGCVVYAITRVRTSDVSVRLTENANGRVLFVALWVCRKG
jgi:hypothetical protein